MPDLSKRKYKEGKYTVTEYPNGTLEYRWAGVLHRDEGPAIIKSDGSLYYYISGALERKDGPAVILKDGTKKWYCKDCLHREDGPAIEYADGRKCWVLYGRLIKEEDFFNQLQNLSPIGRKRCDEYC